LTSATAAFGPDPLLPQPPGGLGRGAALAVAAHAALVAALATSVDWRVQGASEPLVAELWSSVTVAAPPVPAPAPAPTPAPPPAPPPPPPPPAPAPAPPPPPPPPKAPDIAVERERPRPPPPPRPEPERPRPPAPAPAPPDRRALEAERQRAEAAARAEEDRVAKQREENLRRMMGQIGGAPAASPVTGAPSPGSVGAPSAAYAARLVARIKPNIVFTERLPGNPAAEVEVRAAPGGTILARRLVKSSGHPEWDEAVLRAIDRTGSLPRDTDGRVPSEIVISFRPNE
jgi:colicin import membrane protein